MAKNYNEIPEAFKHASILFIGLVECCANAEAKLAQARAEGSKLQEQRDQLIREKEQLLNRNQKRRQYDTGRPAWESGPRNSTEFMQEAMSDPSDPSRMCRACKKLIQPEDFRVHAEGHAFWNEQKQRTEYGIKVPDEMANSQLEYITCGFCKERVRTDDIHTHRAIHEAEDGDWFNKYRFGDDYKKEI